ncbi:MAG TPA: cobaltochelatase subunit CobN, partial [Blastocatellia bacterium]
MKIAVFYVGTSLLAPLRRAESDINKLYAFDLRIAAHNCGAPLAKDEWRVARRDIEQSDLVFIIHVTEGENASRIAECVDEFGGRHNAVIAFNCMPDLMRRTRMGKLDFAALMKQRKSGNQGRDEDESSRNMVRKLGSWMGDFIKGSRDSNGGGPRRKSKAHANKGQYVKLIGRLPSVLKFVPNAGRLRDVKNYLLLFCYFLQPTPNNIRSMLLYAIKPYVSEGGQAIKIDPPESMPAVAIYHPDSPHLFESFEAYEKWYVRTRNRNLDRDETVGLLLMRPQIVSNARRHYDGLIRAIEREGLGVIPAISTFMDNREACREFFVERAKSHVEKPIARVSQIVSLTGFSFVGGPAMNDSEAAVEFFKGLNVSFRSVVSLDVQTIESWRASKLGLNPIQTAMQVAIPEIDGATEPFVFGGLTENSDQPEAIEDRCGRIARRLARWNRLSVAQSSDLRLAFLVFCFPPDKGNIGTAADLDVFPSLWEILARLKAEGYTIELPASADHLREILLGGNSG